jgi:hypothetical protein
MKSKLLQKISYSQTHQSDDLLDDQQENTDDSSEPLGVSTRNRTTRSTWLLTPRPLRKHSSGSGA